MQINNNETTEKEKDVKPVYTIELPNDSNVQDEEEFKPLYRQIAASVGPILSTIGAGMLIGYSAILLPQLLHADSLIKITRDESSWIGKNNK